MEKVEQRSRPHFERALFVMGNQNDGKSTLLRNMFRDARFGRGGKIPTERVVPTFALSNERCLKVRFTSPHENNEDLEEFFTGIDREMERACNRYSRFNFACPLQPAPAKRMRHGVVEVCDEFKQQFNPERIRLVQIHPTVKRQDGTLLNLVDVDRLKRLRIEVLTVNARHMRTLPHANGLLLADYFDFT